VKKFLLLATYIVTFFVLNGVAAATNEYYGYFVDIDSNHDEYITWEEFYRYFPFATRLVFDKIDSDHNALVSYDEWRYFKERYGYGNRRRYGQQYVDTQGYRYIFIDGFWYKVGHRRRISSNTVITIMIQPGSVSNSFSVTGTNLAMASLFTEQVIAGIP